MLPPGWFCRGLFACTKGGFRPYSYSTDTAENWMRWRLPQVLHEPKETSCLELNPWPGRSGDSSSAVPMEDNVERRRLPQLERALKESRERLEQSEREDTLRLRLARRA